MKFKTIKKAEDYYFEKISRTNNMHGEEDKRLDNWLDEQEIEEIKLK